MKKIFLSAFALLAMALPLAANGAAEEKPLTIGITKIVAHPAPGCPGAGSYGSGSRKLS